MKLLAIVDQFLELRVQKELNCLPMHVPAEMATGRTEGDWSYWIPIKSSVSPEELTALEQELGVSLSPQYKSLLEHKHFLELQIGEVSVFAHPSVGWQESIKKHVLKGWPRELLLDRGFLPFADYSDWGLWCFATREVDSEGESAVYLWDHDRPDQLKWVAGSLESAIANEALRASASQETPRK